MNSFFYRNKWQVDDHIYQFHSYAIEETVLLFLSILRQDKFLVFFQLRFITFFWPWSPFFCHLWHVCTWIIDFLLPKAVSKGNLRLFFPRKVKSRKVKANGSDLSFGLFSSQPGSSCPFSWHHSACRYLNIATKFVLWSYWTIEVFMILEIFVY